MEILGSSDNLVEGDLIGTDATGTKSLGNAQWGVNILDASTGNTIGGTVAAAADVISGNIGAGVEIEGSSENLVEGNFIGTDATGTIALGNTQFGVNITADAVGVHFTFFGFLVATGVGRISYLQITTRSAALRQARAT